MAPPHNSFVDKVVVTVFLFALVNVNEGHGFFYQTPGDGRPQGQPLYNYQEPPNQVGYGYKPTWAEVHLQALAEETPQYQPAQPQQGQPAEKSPYPSEPQYTVPAHTYLQQSDKYQIPPPKYQWIVQPSVKYNIPTIGNPLTYRDPHHHVNVLVPLRYFGVQMFPPFLERLIQRVQTYYSIYNPPETLTLPYNINTPPTFPTSSLLPPGDTFVSPEDETNVINTGNFPIIEANPGENNEGVTETAVTGSPNGSRIEGSSTTESTAETDSSNEDTTKEESAGDSTEPSSSDDSSKSDNGNEDTSSSSSAPDTDDSAPTDTTEPTNSDDQSSSTDKADSDEPTTESTPSES